MSDLDNIHHDELNSNEIDLSLRNLQDAIAKSNEQIVMNNKRLTETQSEVRKNIKELGDDIKKKGLLMQVLKECKEDKNFRDECLTALNLIK